MNTDADSRLDTLLSRWERLRQEGRDVTADELCAECPELGAEVRRRIQALVAIERLIPFIPLPTPPESANATRSEGRDRFADEAETETKPTSHLLPLPVVIDGYELLEQIGAGGMGVVYLARQIELNRLVAVKMILGGKYATEEHRTRFRTEARAIARLEHPNIVAVHATGEQEGLPYFAMQLLEGGSLSKRLKQEAMPPRQAVQLVRDLALAVETAHRGGVVHRDLKPANVLFSSDGTAKITDFGLARLLDATEGLTSTDAIMGTPGYFAPEQASGQSSEAGPPADIYALGALLYQCLAGVAPFHGLKGLDILKATLETAPLPPSKHRAGIAADLEAVCLKCLAKEPGRRYPTAQALADDLERWLNGEPTVVRPPGLLTRFGRGVRRRPLLLGSVAFAAFLALAVPLAVSFLDPQRPVRDMQEQLAKGRETPLLGNDGSPRWQRWGVAAAGTKANAQRKELAFQSFQLSLLEVLPSTNRDRYRFSVRIRQDEGIEGDVGIFFALQRIATPQGEVLFYCPLTFNDLESRGQPPTGFLALNLRASTQAGATGESRISTSVRTGRVLSFQPSRLEGGRGPWRRLDVEVTGQRVRTYWEGGLAQDLTCEQMNAKLQNWLATQPPLAGLDIRFDVRGGLGFLVDQASAVYSDAVVEPLTTDE